MKKDLEKYRKIKKIISEDISENPDKLTPRQRLSKLFDDGAYKELFRFAKNSLKNLDFNDGIICASGMIHSRPALAYATEFKVLGGSLGTLQTNQVAQLFRLARQSGIPIIALSESAGARITESFQIMEGFALAMKEATYCSGVIPQITCIFGLCIGASGFMATLGDFIIMEKESSLSIAGSAVNRAATGENYSEKQLGGTDIHNNFSGANHFTEVGEENVIKKARELMLYLPQNNSEKPPFIPTSDSEIRVESSVEELIPENTETPFDIKKLLTLFTDDNNFFEVQAEFAPNMVIGFARFGGYTVGIAANQSLHMAGVLDCDAFRKMARFLNFLSCYNFPLITFVDVPGALPTQEENKNGILMSGAQLVHAMGHLKSFKMSIVVRRCFGGAYVMLIPKASSGDLIYAYPGAMIGVMSDKAVSQFMGKDSALAEKVKKIQESGQRTDDPLLPAAMGFIDDIIEPSETRKEIIHGLKMFGNKRFLDIPPKWMPNQPL